MSRIMAVLSDNESIKDLRPLKNRPTPQPESSWPEDGFVARILGNVFGRMQSFQNRMLNIAYR